MYIRLGRESRFTCTLQYEHKDDNAPALVICARRATTKLAAHNFSHSMLMPSVFDPVSYPVRSYYPSLRMLLRSNSTRAQNRVAAKISSSMDHPRCEGRIDSAGSEARHRGNLIESRLSVWAIAAHGRSESYGFFWYLGSRFTFVYEDVSVFNASWICCRIHLVISTLHASCPTSNHTVIEPNDPGCIKYRAVK
ncbi:hypothetical protein ARMSODRAFT_1054541 [Armillaria solidipes]|uniref:Uncharacterized protein n=1 Tax=Armillaria solidipes TaxID=1076256 RepID=A0A2H3BMN3_9AGAR|nr:hypothetical protein ARMSODRAFT_1054541 [Armillaria solidipes]